MVWYEEGRVSIGGEGGHCTFVGIGTEYVWDMNRGRDRGMERNVTFSRF